MIVSSASSSLELVRDFVNTSPFEGQSETLTNRAAPTRWLRAHGIPDTADAREGVEAREALRELLLANDHLPAGARGSACASTVLLRALYPAAGSCCYAPRCSR